MILWCVFVVCAYFTIAEDADMVLKDRVYLVESAKRCFLAGVSVRECLKEKAVGAECLHCILCSEAFFEMSDKVGLTAVGSFERLCLFRNASDASRKLECREDWQYTDTKEELGDRTQVPHKK